MRFSGFYRTFVLLFLVVFMAVRKSVCSTEQQLSFESRLLALESLSNNRLALLTTTSIDVISTQNRKLAPESVFELPLSEFPEDAAYLKYLKANDYVLACRSRTCALLDARTDSLQLLNTFGEDALRRFHVKGSPTSFSFFNVSLSVTAAGDASDGQLFLAVAAHNYSEIWRVAAGFTEYSPTTTPSGADRLLDQPTDAELHDEPWLSNVLSFSDGNYTYFVRNACRLRPGLADVCEWVVRLTIICMGDASMTLRSTLNLALQCGESAVGLRAAAAAVAPDGEQLWIVTERVGYHRNVAINNGHVCGFNLQDIHLVADNIFKVCNGTSRYSATQCWGKSSDSDFCYYRYVTEKSEGVCSVPSTSTERRSRCSPVEDTMSRLESFKPVVSAWRVQIDLAPFGRVLSMSVDNDAAWFLAGSTGVVARLTTTPPNIDHSRWLWNRTANMAESKQPLVLQDGALFLLNDSHEVLRVDVTCESLYGECETALHSRKNGEPLGCGWCVADEAPAEASTSESATDCVAPRHFLTLACPPVIEGVTAQTSDDTLKIHGRRLTAFGDTLSVTVCGEKCAVLEQTEHMYASLDWRAARGVVGRISCQSSLRLSADFAASCAVVLAGRLEAHELRVAGAVDLAGGTPTAQSTGDDGDGSLSMSAAVLVAALLLLLVGFVGLLLLWSRGRRKRPTPRPASDLIPFRNGYLPPRGAAANSYDSNPHATQMDALPSYEDLSFLVPELVRIPLDQLRLDMQIGQGHFGIVYKATYFRPSGAEEAVAVKTLHASVSGVREFLQEGLRMENFNHNRVMSLIGISFTDDHYPMIVTKFMACGDLLSYIKNPNNTPTVRQLLNFGIQIAEGMQYLHKLKFIHRDLAARNCMLDTGLNVKIADFGLTRDVYESGLYESRNPDRQIPLRWMAIEAIERLEYTFKGDVWSYGVVLFELTSRGAVPYIGVQGYELLHFLNSGSRLARPDHCPLELYEEVMLACWRARQQERPSFADLCVAVPAVVRALERSATDKPLLECHYEPVSHLSVA